MAEIVQGSPEWFKARLGMVTASRIVDVMAKGRGGGASVTRKNYMAQLVAERLSGNPTETFKSGAMEWGTDNEDQARSAYEFLTDNTVRQVGFIRHPKFEMAGASPDGIVGNKGLIEIKCPNTATHIDTLQSQKVDRKYMLQMQWQIDCTDSDWCDFVSFDPRLPGNVSLFCKRVSRDDELISEIRSAVDTFLGELNQLQETLETHTESEAVA